MLSKPPLPFIGNKKNFKTDFIEALTEKFTNGRVFVDLFGGSGFLSHVIKRTIPYARVIFNDFDNYSERWRNIDKTNRQLRAIKGFIGQTPKNRKLDENIKNEIIKYLEAEPYIDYVTISSRLLYTNNVAKSFDELKEPAFYNRTTKTDIPPCVDYLKDVEIRHEDFRDLYNEFKDTEGVVFIIDPPYFAALKKQYACKFWNWSDFIPIIEILRSQNRWIYFTNKESQTLELLEYIDKITPNRKIDIKNTVKYERVNTCGAFAHFTDVMVVHW